MARYMDMKQLKIERKMKKSIHFAEMLASAVVLLAIVGCAQYDDEYGAWEEKGVYDTPDVQPGKALVVDAGADLVPIQLSESEVSLVKSGNVFDLQLLAEAADMAGKKENVLISPLSLQMALGMLGNGLSDAAFEEMASVVYQRAVTRQELNAYFSSLYEPLTNCPDGSICRLANSLWVQSGYAIKPAFMTTLEECCNARASYVDFVHAPQDAKAYMNDWAKEMTDGMIPELSVRVDDMTRAVLLNATLLRTAWTFPFVVMDAKQPFTSASNKKQKVTMMNTAVRGAVKCEQFTRVSKEYGNGQFEMTLCLPDEGSSVEEIIPHLFDEGEALDVLVYLRLPKFEYRVCNDFIPMMEHLGIHHLFDDADALSGINDQLMVSQVLQDAYINVNERGTEAAAVSEISISYGSSEPGIEKEMELYFDRPFVYILREASTGVLLFAGCVNTL